MRHLPPGHARQPAIIADIKKIKAGYNGEYRVFQSLKSLPEKEYLLFHDLHLFGSPFPFQMDILILTSSFLLILEVKNMAGEIFKCSAFTMERKSKKWICRTCLDISLDAHISALYDYLYLVKPTITNNEFRNFVQLQSPSSAKNYYFH